MYKKPSSFFGIRPNKYGKFPLRCLEHQARFLHRWSESHRQSYKTQHPTSHMLFIRDYFISLCFHVHMLREVHTCQLHACGGQDSFQESVLIFHVEIRSLFLFLPVCSRLCKLLAHMTFQWRSSHGCKCRSRHIASYIQNTREKWEKFI